MKLLLTSAGITNSVLGNELCRLCDKTAQEIKIGFIPTAANVEEGNKDWFFAQTNNLVRFGFSWIDVVDISAANVDWRTRLGNVDVVCVGGGNTFYLLDQLRRVGFKEWMDGQNKVYVGVSAGSIVASLTIDIALLPPADPNIPDITDFSAMDWVGFDVEPHCTKIRLDEMDMYAKEVGKTVYALDDESAVSVDGDSVMVVSESDNWRLAK